MSAFPLTMTADGVTLMVGVSAPQVYVTSTTKPQTWNALVDTGATMTVISPAVVLALRPPLLGTLTVGRSGGVQTWEPTHEVRIRFGGHRAHGRWFALEAVSIQPATPQVDVILGLDLLMLLDLIWWGPSRRGVLSY